MADGDGDGDTTTTTVPPNHEMGSSPINGTQFPMDSKVGWHSSFFANIDGLTNVRDSAGERETISSCPDLRNPSSDEAYAPLARRRTRVDLSSRSGEIDNSGVVPNEIFPISSTHQRNDIPLPATPRAMKRKGLSPYDAENFKYLSPSTAVFTPEKEIVDDFNSSRDHTSPIRYSTDKQDHSSLPTSFGKQGIPPSYQSCVIRQRTYQTHKRNLNGRTGPSLSKNLPTAEPFDICRREEMCESELFKQDAGSNMCELEHVGEDATALPRPGMVLLRSFLTKTEQIHIVKKCRDIGMGPGGFYQPCFASGAKLRLQMMCLGLDWDPQTRKYSKKRTHDGSKPPPIPPEFDALVRRAILNAHALIKDTNESGNVEEILPTMSPNICIVNFYNTTGRLGLHQDRDESRESLRNKLPVVSFSIGDCAEFLYGHTRDTEKAKRVILESGDVLIFGGESRHIFHGVKSIIPNSAPKFLLEESNSKLRPGRLNLTFRQY